MKKSGTVTRRHQSDSPAPDAGLLHHSDQGCTYASEEVVLGGRTTKTCSTLTVLSVV